MAVLFCFTLKISKGKKQNHLPKCVYRGWAFAPVRFICLLDFTVAVLLSVLSYFSIDELFHLFKEYFFQQVKHVCSIIKLDGSKLLNFGLAEV